MTDPLTPPRLDMIAMGAGAEFDVLRELVHRWGVRATGIGDDAAVFDAPAGQRLVVSTDAFVEGVHTLPGWLTPEECGWRAATAALSDLAAMGAAAAHILVAFTASEIWRTRLGAVAEGIGAAAEAAGATIVGGNLSRGPVFSITTTVIGHATNPVSRAGAQPGDALVVTGVLGGPASATRALYAGATPSAWSRARFAHPEPRIGAGAALARLGATAMIDISDGLLAEAGHLAAAGEVAIRVDVDALPMGTGVDLASALYGGEEYELLATVPPDAVGEMRRVLAANGVPLTMIGRVERREAGLPAVRLDARSDERASASDRVEFASGHDHFSR